MLEEMDSSMYIEFELRCDKEGPIYEMAHVVNNVVPLKWKKVWQDLFSYVYKEKHLEDAEFGQK